MVLFIIQIILGLALIAAIILQSQGGGLSTTFGGSGEFYRSKRSVEKLLVYVTIAITAVLAVVSIALLIPH